MHYQIALQGKAAQLMMPYHTQKGFYQKQKLMNKLVKGLWLSHKTDMEEDYLIREDGSLLRILIVRSKKHCVEHATGLLWMHGGGYAIGLPEQDFIFADLFCANHDCVMVLPDYTKSVEKPYPAALEDCYHVLRWMHRHHEKLGINPDQLFVGGNSAGGGLCAALCLYARDRKEVPIAFQMPLYPMLDDRPTLSSQDNHAPVWNSRSNQEAWKLYTQDLEEIPVYCAPARCEDYTNLPPAYSYIGTLEPFFMETLVYFRRLAQAGNRAHLRVYEGCYHAFDLMGMGTGLAKQAHRHLQEQFFYAQKHYGIR